MALRWNYTLGSSETLKLTQWKIDGIGIGLLTTAPSSVVYDKRFIISTSEVATVIIKNVSDIKDATFECMVHTSVGLWKYKIRVGITGERHILNLHHRVVFFFFCFRAYTMVITLKFPMLTTYVLVTNKGK